MLSYGGIGFILVGLTSAAYLHFKQKQNPILRWISWSFITNAIAATFYLPIYFILRKKNIPILKQLSWVLLAGIGNILMFIPLGCLLPIVFKRFISFKKTF